jgi:hypothetical protein
MRSYVGQVGEHIWLNSTQSLINEVVSAEPPRYCGSLALPTPLFDALES